MVIAQNRELALLIPRSSKGSEWVSRKLISFISKRYRGIAPKSLNEVRLLVQELFSNSVKHTDSESVNVRCRITDSILELWFLNVGRGFKIKPMLKDKTSKGFLPPYPVEYINKDVLIAKTTGYNLYCTISNSHEFSLYSEAAENNFKINALPEHYGLLIISRLSDTVTYKMESGQNDYCYITKTLSVN